LFGAILPFNILIEVKAQIIIEMKVFMVVWAFLFIVLSDLYKIEEETK